MNSQQGMAMDGERKLRLGEWLIGRGHIRRNQLFEALSLTYRRRCRVGEALVQMGVLPRDVLERELAAVQAARAAAAVEGALAAAQAESAAAQQRRPTPPPIPAAVASPRPRAGIELDQEPDESGLIYLLVRRKQG